jgi:hypothetical protein
MIIYYSQAAQTLKDGHARSRLTVPPPPFPTFFLELEFEACGAGSDFAYLNASQCHIAAFQQTLFPYWSMRVIDGSADRLQLPVVQSQGI